MIKIVENYAFTSHFLADTKINRLRVRDMPLQTLTRAARLMLRISSKRSRYVKVNSWCSDSVRTLSFCRAGTALLLLLLRGTLALTINNAFQLQFTENLQVARLDARLREEQGDPRDDDVHLGGYPCYR